ncbi:hypothetical protein [Rhodococcus koreensis]
MSSVTVRRQLAEPALINVRFSSLDQLAHRLETRHMALSSVRPLTLAARARAVRTCTGRLAEAAAHPGTAALIEDVCAELDGVETFDGDRLDHIAATNPRGREVAEIYEAYRREVAGRPTAPELLDTARDAVCIGEAPDTEGIVFAPRRLSTVERRLLRSFADRGRLRCLLARTGDTPADADSDDLLGWLRQLHHPLRWRSITRGCDSHMLLRDKDAEPPA